MFLSLTYRVGGNLFQKVFHNIWKNSYRIFSEKYRPHSRRDLINNWLDQKIKYF